MAETTKRARSPSPLQALGSEAKRAKEEEQQAADAQISEGMTTEGATATVAKNEEVDAVELGLPHEGEESSEMESKEEKVDGEGLLSGSVIDVNDSGHADADGQPANIAIRALIVTGDASVIIGKQGKHINEIRDKSGAKLTIVSLVERKIGSRRCQYTDTYITICQSESLPGNPERILTVAGPLDAVSKVRRVFGEKRAMKRITYICFFNVQAFGLIVRRINDEPFDQASVPGSRAVTIRFIVPHARMGSVIGKQGSKIKEIQEASGARLTAGEAMLPGSTEVSRCEESKISCFSDFSDLLLIYHSESSTFLE